MKKRAKPHLDGTKRLTSGLAHHRWPVLSPDGERLAFAIGDGFEQSWAIADRKGRIGRLFEGPADGGACFGRDGSFAFGRRAGTAAEIWFAPSPAATAVRLLGGDGRTYQGPALSPDGKLLAFVADDEGQGRMTLQLLEIESGKRHKIVSDAYGSAGRPAFAPTGELYFDGSSQGRLAIWRVDLQSRTVVRVSAEDVSYRRPAPIRTGLVLAEKHVEGKSAVRLVLLDEADGAEYRLSDLDEAREPSCVVIDGKIRVAFICLAEAADGEPRRFDVHLARLRGLPSSAVADVAAPLPSVLEASS
jgi:Tol biopolymer transport system component